GERSRASRSRDPGGVYLSASRVRDGGSRQQEDVEAMDMNDYVLEVVARDRQAELLRAAERSYRVRDGFSVAHRLRVALGPCARPYRATAAGRQHIFWTEERPGWCHPHAKGPNLWSGAWLTSTRSWPRCYAAPMPIAPSDSSSAMGAT